MVSHPDESAGSTANEQALPGIEALPKEVGAMLVAVGLLGVALPGMMGTPAIIAGGLVLWPRTFGKVDAWFRCRYPETHKQGMRQIGRYLDDLQRRYSDPKKG
jgi:hypothetical protein